jgi:hypothetical protein
MHEVFQRVGIMQTFISSLKLSICSEPIRKKSQDNSVIKTSNQSRMTGMEGDPNFFPEKITAGHLVDVFLSCLLVPERDDLDLIGV